MRGACYRFRWKKPCRLRASIIVVGCPTALRITWDLMCTIVLKHVEKCIWMHPWKKAWSSRSSQGYISNKKTWPFRKNIAALASESKTISLSPLTAASRSRRTYRAPLKTSKRGCSGCGRASEMIPSRLGLGPVGRHPASDRHERRIVGVRREDPGCRPQTTRAFPDQLQVAAPVAESVQVLHRTVAPSVVAQALR